MNGQSSLEVGFFWDYENIRVPSHVNAVAVAQQSLRTVSSNAAQQLGFAQHRIVERRLYYDSRKPSEINVDRSGLGSSFTLIDCPARGHKETVDKRIIVDLMLFAYERVLKGAPVCVVLMSSDGDFTYILSVLRDLGAKVVIIYGANVATRYLETANYSFHWQNDVLRRGVGVSSAAVASAVSAAGWEAPATPLNRGWAVGAAPEAAASIQPAEAPLGVGAADDDDDVHSKASSSVHSDDGSGVQAPLQDDRPVETAPSSATPSLPASAGGGGGGSGGLPSLLLYLNGNPGSEPSTATPSLPTQAGGGSGLLNFLNGTPGMKRVPSVGSDATYDGRHRELLLCLRKVQQLAIQDAPPGAQFEEMWVPETVLEEEYLLRKLAVKTVSSRDAAWTEIMYKELRASALEAGFLEMARSDLRSAVANSQMVPQAEWARMPDGALSTMRYVRLTQAGARADAEDEEDMADYEDFSEVSSAFGDAPQDLADDHLVAEGGRTATIGRTVGPTGATRRCNRGADCYHLRSSSCSFLHTEAEVQAVEAQREQGTVIVVKPEYGFIKPDAGGENCWFHVSFTALGSIPARNSRVKYFPANQNKTGQPIAKNVQVIGSASDSGRTASPLAPVPQSAASDE